MSSLAKWKTFAPRCDVSLPAADGTLRATTVCLYTNTPDEHFWIDRHPLHPQVLIASACSGHGFKFSPVIGEILADLAQCKQPRFDLSLFRKLAVAKDVVHEFEETLSELYANACGRLPLRRRAL